MRILLTGARAPVTLDLSRALAAWGHAVFACDSLRFGCTALSNRVDRFFLVSGPRESPLEFIDQIATIVRKEKIDLLIPTCEEIFFIARFRQQIPCEVLIDSFEKIDRIHDKWRFAEMLKNLPGTSVTVPPTNELTSNADLERFVANSKEFVFKPKYSRFASETLISPDAETLRRIVITGGNHWVAQERVHGIEYSTYSVARDGRLLAHACYASSWRAGQGSGIYIRLKLHERIENFVRAFIDHYQFTGQIGFDCIVDDADQPWIIEGNPRATSGLHLFGGSRLLTDALLGNDSEARVHVPSVDRPNMIGFAMPFWGLAQAVRQRKLTQFFKDFWRGKDILFRWSDPLPTIGLPLTMAELMVIAIRKHQTLQQASTHDIEFNGESL